MECQKHNRISAATEVDHVIPLHKGGTDDYDNLQGLCHNCHADKTRVDKGQRAKIAIGLNGYPE